MRSPQTEAERRARQRVRARVLRSIHPTRHGCAGSGPSQIPLASWRSYSSWSNVPMERCTSPNGENVNASRPLDRTRRLLGCAVFEVNRRPSRCGWSTKRSSRRYGRLRRAGWARRRAQIACMVDAASRGNRRLRVSVSSSASRYVSSSSVWTLSGGASRITLALVNV